jgi:membrane protein implicated in regulation of membrane protease activity
MDHPVAHSLEQMFIFGALIVAALIVLGFSALFGHGDVDHEGIGGHDPDGPTISFLSPRIFATFALGFGAAGLVATEYNWSPLASSGAGVGAGLVLAFLARLMYGFFYSQQSDSTTQTESAIGCRGEVTSPIPEHGSGEVSLTVQGRFQVYPARSLDGRAFTKGKLVSVEAVNGGVLVVAEPSRK